MLTQQYIEISTIFNQSLVVVDTERLSAKKLRNYFPKTGKRCIRYFKFEATKDIEEDFA